MEDKELVVESTTEQSQDEPKPMPTIDIDLIGEAMAAAGRR